MVDQRLLVGQSNRCGYKYLYFDLKASSIVFIQTHSLSFLLFDCYSAKSYQEIWKDSIKDFTFRIKLSWVSSLDPRMISIFYGEMLDFIWRPILGIVGRIDRKYHLFSLRFHYCEVSSLSGKLFLWAVISTPLRFCR